MGIGITIPFLPVVPNKAFQFCSVLSILTFAPTFFFYHIISSLRYGVRVVPCFTPHVTIVLLATMYILLFLITTSQP